MPVEMNQPKMYTIKYLDQNGALHFHPVTALGTSDAKDQFTKGFPDCQLLDIVRRQ